MEIDKDHIHLLLEVKPSLSISSVVNRLKSMTTNRIWKKCDLSKYYWNSKVLWTHGYFVSTVGYINEDIINNYIKNQGA